jgi:hypothetical protein
MLQSRAGNSTIKDSGFNITKIVVNPRSGKILGPERKAKLDEALATERRR